MFTTKTTKYAYNKFVKKLNFDIKVKSKWENIVGRQILDNNRRKIFTLPGKLTLSTPMRIFQYKIIHRILLTNKLLHIYKLRENSWCDICPNIIETLEHTFHSCPRILTLWYNRPVPFYQYILLGVPDQLYIY